MDGKPSLAERRSQDIIEYFRGRAEEEYYLHSLLMLDMILAAGEGQRMGAAAEIARRAMYKRCHALFNPATIERRIIELEVARKDNLRRIRKALLPA